MLIGYFDFTEARKSPHREVLTNRLDQLDINHTPASAQFVSFNFISFYFSCSLICKIYKCQLRQKIIRIGQMVKFFSLAAGSCRGRMQMPAHQPPRSKINRVNLVLVNR